MGFGEPGVIRGGSLAAVPDGRTNGGATNAFGRAIGTLGGGTKRGAIGGGTFGRTGVGAAEAARSAAIRASIGSGGASRAAISLGRPLPGRALAAGSGADEGASFSATAASTAGPPALCASCPVPLSEAPAVEPAGAWVVATVTAAGFACPGDTASDGPAVSTTARITDAATKTETGGASGGSDAAAGGARFAAPPDAGTVAGGSVPGATGVDVGVPACGGVPEGGAVGAGAPGSPGGADTICRLM